MQDALVEKILQRFSKKSEAVENLMQLLDIGQDGVYRRLRGTSAFSPEEIRKIALTYGISLDGLLDKREAGVFWQYNAFTERIGNFHDYLSGVEQNLTRALKLDGVELYYASTEIPVFHYFYNRALTAFKLYVWGVTSLGFKFTEDRKFSFDLVAPDVWRMVENITTLYNRLPDVQIYSLNVIDFTLNHIEYIAQIDAFKDREDAFALCEAVREVMQHARAMGKAGLKFSPGREPDPEKGTRFKLYHNELVSTNNTLLISSSQGRMLYTTFGNPNFLSTTDERMCEYAHTWLKTTIGRSTHLGPGAQRERTGFFARINAKIDVVKRRIERIYEDRMVL